MPLQIANSRRPSYPDPSYLTLDNFKRGVITLIDKSRLPRDALEEADNIFLYEDGQPGPRPGVDWYGIAPVTSSSSTKSAGTVEDDSSVGTIAWSTPSNATSSNDSYATAAFSPSNDLVENSIRVVKNDTISGSELSTGAALPTSDTYVTYGSSTNLLGETWTAEDINSAGFGAVFSAKRSGSTTSHYLKATNFGFSIPTGSVINGIVIEIEQKSYLDDVRTAGVDHIRITVYYTASGEIDGFDYFDFDGAIHLVAVAGGVVYRSTNDAATWTECTGGTFTSGQTVNMNQNGSYLYMTSGHASDNILRYDGTTTLQAYATLATPAAPTVAEVGTLGGSGNTFYYKIARVNAVGFSIASDVGGVSVATNLDRADWSTTNYASITTPNGVATQTRWDIYISTDNVDFFYLDSVAAVSGSASVYNDYGTAIPVPSTLAPTASTAQGPKVAELTNVGSRQFGVRDASNRYRIWFTGAGTYAGAFSSAYDGGYLDWQEGGKLIPVKVVDYRSGRGDPIATIWCKSADGQGGILQMSLETLTVGDISITVPSAYLLPGSRGTPAPGSVVNVLNDYMFYNSQAFYNIGNRANLQQILSTDEVSANIRPTIRQITNSAEDNIASVYFDARVYFSVPYGSDTNNHTAIYDTERRCWLPTAFTIGFKKFLRYTDTTGTQHLLALKPGDSRLSEIGYSIQGDYGEAFSTSLLTGLYSTTRNRFDFQFTEEGEIELSNPQGEINIDLIGIERSQGFRTQNSETVTATLSSGGWDSFLWDSMLWDDTSNVTDTFSESSVKRYFTIQRELNAVQWAITTNSLDARYVLRTLQTWGTDTFGGKPRSWRL